MAEKRTYTLPPAINGLDSVSAINQLDETSALTLTNFYPEDGALKVRKGFSAFYDTAVNNPAKTVTSLILGDGTKQLIFAANGNVYKLISGTATSFASGLSSDIWQSVVFNYKLFAVNGTDTPFYFDGTTKTNLTFTGVTLTDLVNVNTYKERLYFIEKNSGSIWYPGTVKAITGALTELNLEYVTKLGGTIIMCGGFANNANVQVEDLFYALSSEGELFFYSGAYPGDSAWQLVARYRIGRPLGYRAAVELENDLLFLTDKGIISCAALLSGTPTTALNTIGRNVNKLIREAAEDLPFSYLWDGAFWTAGSRLFINCPTSETITKHLVCNVQTGAWCLYEYNNAGSSMGVWHSIGIHDGHPYAGAADGKIGKLEDGFTDNDNEIEFDLLYGYNYFKSQQLKRFTEIRPLIKTASNVDIEVSMRTDYRELAESAIITTTGSYTAWGSPWGSPWSSPVETKYARSGLSGSGHSGALRISGSIQDVPLEIYAFEISIEDGARR